MKNLNRLFAGILAGAMVLGAPSCGNDFLEEDSGHLLLDGLLSTPEGVEQMVGSLYGNIRWWGGYEWAYATTIYGCDEFTVAASNNSEPWNDYTANFSPVNWAGSEGDSKNNPGINAVWDQMYYGISTANLLISSENLMPASIHDRALGEAYFLRGYNYLRLFGQYGAVVLQTKPVEVVGSDVPRFYPRATEEEILGQIIDDFKKAYELIPADNNWVYYAWTKYTAAHFLAKALLWRQSERCSSWNGAYNAKTDLDRAIQLCDEVIANRPIESDYNNLYAHWTGVDCDIESSKEVLMAIPHNETAASSGRFGNRTYNYFNPQFSNFSNNFVRRGQFLGGMDFQRCRPTEYTYSVFDNVNDSRLWKTFTTIYGYNNYQTPETVHKLGCPEGAEPELGDPAIMYILNKKGTSVAQYGTPGRGAVEHTFVYPEGVGKAENWYGKWVSTVVPLYDGNKYEMDKHGVTGDTGTSNNFCGINKTNDGSRIAEKGDAHRDITLARTGETYLIKAECQVRNGDANGALATINQLRARAQYKAGEDREAYEDGSQAFTNGNSTSSVPAPNSPTDANGHKLTNLEAHLVSYITTNTYCISTGLEKPEGGWGASDLQISSWSNLPEEDMAVLNALGVSPTTLEGQINFIFNERTRELLGEWNRWEELSRTNLLVKRAKLFNPEATHITAGKHEYRPIPQGFIDALLNDDGSVLTPEQKAAWQNPGY